MALSKVDPNFLNVSQVGGRRNLIINGDHQVQQRGTTFTTSGSDRFASDRWALNPVGASPCSASIQFDSTLQKNTLRVTKETSAGDIQIIQRIEGFKQFHNKQYTLSYYVKANAARTLYIASGFSHAGGFQSIANTSVSGTTQWQRFTHTFSATDLSGYTENSSSNLRIEFRIGDGVTNVNPADYIEFTDVQIEFGDTATPFEHRSYGEEEALCQRYFYASDNGEMNCVMGTTNEGLGMGSFPVKMRASPTAYASGGGAINTVDIRYFNGSATLTTFTTCSTSRLGIQYFSVVGSGTQGLPVRPFPLWFDAEI